MSPLNQEYTSSPFNITNPNIFNSIQLHIWFPLLCWCAVASIVHPSLSISHPLFISSSSLLYLCCVYLLFISTSTCCNCYEFQIQISCCCYEFQIQNTSFCCENQTLLPNFHSKVMDLLIILNLFLYTAEPTLTTRSTVKTSNQPPP